MSKQGAPILIRPRRRSPNAVCHFPQKLRISSKCSPPGSPIRSFFVLFWSLFYKSGPRGPGPHPKVPTRHQHGPQGYPNGAQGCRNEAPRSPQSAQKPPTIPHVCQNGSPRCHNGAKRPPKVLKRHHKALQSATKTQKNMYKPPAAGCSPKAT